MCMASSTVTEKTIIYIPMRRQSRDCTCRVDIWTEGHLPSVWGMHQLPCPHHASHARHGNAAVGHVPAFRALLCQSVSLRTAKQKKNIIFKSTIVAFKSILPVDELGPSYWEDVLLRWAACHLHQLFTSCTVLAITDTVLWAQGYHGVLDDEVVLETLARCQVGADVFSLLWNSRWVLEGGLLQEVGESGGSDTLLFEVLVQSQCLLSLHRSSF